MDGWMGREIVNRFFIQLCRCVTYAMDRFFIRKNKIV